MFITILDQVPFLGTPAGIAGWSLWLALWGLLAAVLWQGRSFNSAWGRPQWLWLIGLILLAPIGALFVGYFLPNTGILPIPDLPVSVRPPTIMFLSAFPWVFAAGLLGPLAGAVVALVTGGLIALYSGGTLFTPLIYAMIAAGLSILMRQRYRTTFFRMISRPMLAAFLLTLIFPLIHITTLLFVLDELFTVRLDYGLSRVMLDSVAFAVPLLLAAACAEVLAFGMPRFWYGDEDFVPSPAESSLQGRLMFVMAPLIFVWMVVLMAGDWVIASTTAREMIDNQMELTAQNVADGIPFFLETGHSLVNQMASDPVFVAGDRVAVQGALQAAISSLPYFTDVSYWQSADAMIAAYPDPGGIPLSLAQVEYQAIDRALNGGVPFQFYSLPHTVQDGVRIVFVALVAGSTPESPPSGVLIARTDLSKNPLTGSLLAHLDSITEINGQGALIDENGMIIYHTEPAFIGEDFSGELGLTEYHRIVTSSQGTREFLVYLPATGYSWGVVTTAPMREAQIMALRIALPVLGMLALVAFASYLVLRFWVQRVTGSLKQLTDETGRIAGGNLDHPLDLDGADEVGQLGRSFEKMRLNLKSQIDEISRLLAFSQSVASTLEMKALIAPVLQGALSIGASSARIMLNGDVLPLDENSEIQFGDGRSAPRLASLDHAVLRMSTQQAQIVLSNPVRARLVPPDGVPPASLIAIALQRETEHIGVLWVAFDQPRNITKEDVQFITTIANQATLSITNALLYRSARVGRRRVEAILDATPDPVLVVDQRDRLLMINPAGLELLKLTTPPPENTPVVNVVKNEKLLELLMQDHQGRHSVEIDIDTTEIFYVTIAPIVVEGEFSGQVCVLHDISEFKALDALKSEFVDTVSHDLRSPLTLIEGYATMLKMMGGLNDQQLDYTNKIMTGVDKMTRLVSDLLDLGRIEVGVGLRLEMVPVSDIARQAVAGLELQANQKRIKVELNLPTQTMPLVEADNASLQQAVHNLVENAIKYTKSDGKVIVTMTVENNGVLFAIKDTGIGIAPIDQPRLFERFYRAGGRESRQQTGSGLGLAIVKSIAERHHGYVNFESQLGSGSTFFLFIPLRQPQVE